MRILYLPCHSIHEADELSLFWELGHDYFSMGSYANSQNPVDRKRPSIPGNYHPHLIELYNHSTKDDIHPDLIEAHDLVMVMHIPRWIERNWEKMKHKIVVWRSNGQSTLHEELFLAPFRQQGMKIVRWSPKERSIKNYLGEDVIIRAYKDPAEFSGWTGEAIEVITVAQNMSNRGEFVNWRVFNLATQDFPRKLYGPDNETANIPGGELEYNDLKLTLRQARVFFYGGTQPASYTLGFIEAWMTGVPVVAVGPKLGNSIKNGQETYEVPELIENGVSGFWSDDVSELRSFINQLLNDYELAKRVSQAGRQKAIEIFGKETIKEQWRQFFDGLK